MSETSAAAPPAADQRGNPLLFVALVSLALVVAAILVAGFWGDTEAANDLTPLQSDISDLETGPGSPTP